MPTPTPRAPRPIRIATEIAVMPITISISLSSRDVWCFEKICCRKPATGSVLALVSLAQVDDREHHENERLQRHDKDMEHGPAEVQRQLRDAEQRDQDEDQLARIHVAEKSQRQ